MKKILKFIIYFIAFSFFPITLSYYYNDAEINNYQKALNGSYYLEPLTDNESDMMLKELDDIDISYQEKRLNLRKSGISEDDVSEYLDYPDISYVYEKYPGHNPPKNVILDHIACLENARSERVFLTLTFMAIIYLLLWWEKERAKK